MSFYAVFDRVAPAANKYVATLFNGATGRKVVVNRVYRFNWQVSAVVGIQLEQELRFITARTAGTNVLIQREDSNDTITTGIAADTGSTAVTEESTNRGLVKRFFASSEEVVLATALTVPTGAFAHAHDAQLVYWRRYGSKGLVLRQNEGLTIKNITSSTVGTVSYMIEFDDELAT